MSCVAKGAGAAARGTIAVLNRSSPPDATTWSPPQGVGSDGRNERGGTAARTHREVRRGDGRPVRHARLMLQVGSRNDIWLLAVSEVAGQINRLSLRAGDTFTVGEPFIPTESALSSCALVEPFTVHPEDHRPRPASRGVSAARFSIHRRVRACQEGRGRPRRRRAETDARRGPARCDATRRFI